MLPWILFAVALMLLGGSVFVAYRFYRKAVVYDEVFQYLADDIHINLLQFVKMQKMNVMMDEPEIQQAHRNMAIMAKRLNEILTRMEEASGIRLRPPPPLPRPRVVD